jgi:hypothetical protein
MFEVRLPDLEPITPEHSFSHPVPAGESREEDLVFTIPSKVDLNEAVLRIHYYNELREIPLNLMPIVSRQ